MLPLCIKYFKIVFPTQSPPKKPVCCTFMKVEEGERKLEDCCPSWNWLALFSCSLKNSSEHPSGFIIFPGQMSVAFQTAVSAFEGHHTKFYRGKQKKKQECPYLYSCLASTNKNLWRNEDHGQDKLQACWCCQAKEKGEPFGSRCWFPQSLLRSTPTPRKHVAALGLERVMRAKIKGYLMWPQLLQRLPQCGV